MHKSWMEDALNNAPENVDDNITIEEFVNQYSKTFKTLIDASKLLGKIAQDTTNK